GRWMRPALATTLVVFFLAALAVLSLLAAAFVRRGALFLAGASSATGLVPPACGAAVVAGSARRRPAEAGVRTSLVSGVSRRLLQVFFFLVIAMGSCAPACMEAQHGGESKKPPSFFTSHGAVGSDFDSYADGATRTSINVGRRRRHVG